MLFFVTELRRKYNNYKIHTHERLFKELGINIDCDRSCYFDSMFVHPQCEQQCDFGNFIVDNDYRLGRLYLLE